MGIQRIRTNEKTSIILVVCLFISLILAGCTEQTDNPTPEKSVDKEIIETASPSESNQPDNPSDESDYDKLSRYDTESYYHSNKAERYVSYMQLHPELDIITVIIYVNIGLDMPFYSDIKTIEDYRSPSVLVNKYNKLPEDYVPENLIFIPMAYADWEHQATEETVKAFIAMADKASEANIILKATSAYRSYESQKDGYDKAVASGRSVEDVDTLNARPGHSEHQTGLAIDVNNTDYKNWMEGGIYYQYGIWLKENSNKFGFIVRYPEGKEAITGYFHEAWHLRYLGKNSDGEFLSVDVYNSGLTYDEYYVKYLSK